MAMLPITSGGSSYSVTLQSEEDIPRLVMDIAAALDPGDLVTLSGDLGAGKTTFARALIRFLADNPDIPVPSPTFTLMQSYELPPYPVVHADLYRLGDAAAIGGEAAPVGLHQREGRGGAVAGAERLDPVVADGVADDVPVEVEGPGHRRAAQVGVDEQDALSAAGQAVGQPHVDGVQLAARAAGGDAGAAPQHGGALRPAGEGDDEGGGAEARAEFVGPQRGDPRPQALLGRAGQLEVLGTAPSPLPVRGPPPAPPSSRSSWIDSESSDPFSSASSADAAHPSSRTTNALTRWPRRSSGTPITPASRTAAHSIAPLLS